ncbi:TauD/TfdA family dioxygenase [uncultured Roseibium sp.]|uniref:TauD/TfdA family dioxygenase n=1 Tax=uncultured Roseibium sp. TaxID=1936171 RepID=UPI002608B687|nr:TauD/TfdA family dioxygenase [uncultured Roseibium sp.]
MLGTGETGVVLKERGMDVPLETGETAYFNYFWLRDNCPSSFDQETRERAFDIFAESEAPCASSAAISGGVLEITWAGAGHVTRMPLSLLASYAKGEKRADVAKVSRTPWFADHYDHMARFSYSQLTESETEIRCWAKAMLTDGIALLIGLPDTDAALLDTASLIGHVRPSYFGQVFEVKTHIKPTNLAFTSKALPLHTDLPDEDLAPGIQFLHCRANTVEGGNSLFVDGLAVAEDFRLAHPEDFELLVATDVPYFCEHERFDMRSRQHVIELDEYGNVSGVTISQHHADMFDLPQEELDRFYPAFCRFGQMMRREKYLMQFRLNAGECIVFDNHRIVHGRAAYSASSGDRHLRGCYTDRGELRSTFRVLEGKKERTE